MTVEEIRNGLVMLRLFNKREGRIFWNWKDKEAQDRIIQDADRIYEAAIEYMNKEGAENE